MKGFMDWDNINLHYCPEQRKRIIASIKVEVQSINKETKSGIINGYSVNSSKCTCRDFSIKRQPCKHMYRLMSDLGSFDINKFIPNPNCGIHYWGGWDALIHDEPRQKDRKARLYEIEPDEITIDHKNMRAIIRGYTVTLDFCSCPDFNERRLPCKHIYRLAFELDLPI